MECDFKSTYDYKRISRLIKIVERASKERVKSVEMTTVDVGGKTTYCISFLDYNDEVICNEWTYFDPIPLAKRMNAASISCTNPAPNDKRGKIIEKYRLGAEDFFA